jgi:hypothetical protein
MTNQSLKKVNLVPVNPLPCGTLATFSLMAVKPIQHKRHQQRKDDSDDVTAAREGRRCKMTATSNHPPSLPNVKVSVQSNVMTQMRANRAAAVRKRR